MTCNETCPQTVDVTVESNTYEGLSPSLGTPIESGGDATVVLTMPDAGRYHVQAWLVDAATDYWTTTPSANFADTPPDNRWDVITDADGVYTFTVSKSDAKSYRLLCSVGGVVVASDAFGVY